MAIRGKKTGTHYSDAIAMASQITSLAIVYSIIYSGTDQRKHQSSTCLCAGNSPLTGEFPAQKASNAENVSIWWRHHGGVAGWPSTMLTISDGQIWKHFPRSWSFVLVIHWWPVNSPHKGQWRGALMFYVIGGQINGWVKNCEAGNLKRQFAGHSLTSGDPKSSGWPKVVTSLFCSWRHQFVS